MDHILIGALPGPLPVLLIGENPAALIPERRKVRRQRFGQLQIGERSCSVTMLPIQIGALDQ